MPETRADEAALREGEDVFRLLVGAVRDYAIFMLDPQGRVLTWNAGAESLKGWRRDEIVGRHFSTFYPPEDVQAGKCERELAAARRDGRVEDTGWRVRKDGSRFYANVVITALRDEAGELKGYGKVTRDVTERRLADEELRRSEERFRLLVEGVQDYALYMLDPEGRVVLWNRGAERIKGYSAAEVLGRHFSLFYTPEDNAAGKTRTELARALAEGRYEEEGWRVRKDGTRFFANVVITPVRDSEGVHLGFAKVTRDLTQRRKAEETRLRLAQEQAARAEAEHQAHERAVLIERLEQAVRARDDFLTIASHELKTPLHALGLVVSTAAWLLAKNAPVERLRDRLESAVSEVQRLTRLVNDLLDVSRITANRLTLEQDVDLAVLAREVVDRSADEIAKSGSPVTLIAPGPVVGRWDRLRLDQVFTNLLSNALKYGERRPIEVRVETAGDRARLTVKDSGLGIDPVDQGRIFERFERAVSSRNHSGFGLGLWIVKQIVDAMRGTIAVHSKKGEGATFVVEVPVA